MRFAFALCLSRFAPRRVPGNSFPRIGEYGAPSRSYPQSENGLLEYLGFRRHWRRVILAAMGERYVSVPAGRVGTGIEVRGCLARSSSNS